MRINIELDVLSASVIEVSTGIIFATSHSVVDKIFVRNIHMKNGWVFNWKSEFKIQQREIAKLTIRDNASEILGLISTEIRKDHVHVHLAESSPENRGDMKKYLGIGGNLFALACKISLENGFDGVISFFAKTRLIRHYEVNLGDVHFKNHRMFIFPEQAKKLINTYYGNEKQ